MIGVESPRWLLENGHFKEAQRVLMKIRGERNIDDEWKAMQERSKTVIEMGSTWKELKKPHVVRMLILGCSLQVSYMNRSCYKSLLHINNRQEWIVCHIYIYISIRCVFVIRSYSNYAASILSCTMARRSFKWRDLPTPLAPFGSRPWFRSVTLPLPLSVSTMLIGNRNCINVFHAKTIRRS